MAGLPACSDAIRPRCPVVNRRLAVGQWHLPKWGCRQILAGDFRKSWGVGRRACSGRPEMNSRSAGYLNGVQPAHCRRAGKGRGLAARMSAARDSCSRRSRTGTRGAWRVASVVRRARRKRLRLRNAPACEIVSTRRARRRGPLARLAARIHIAGIERRLTLRRILLIGQPVEVHRRVFFRYCKRLSVVTRMSRANIRMFRETTYLNDTARRNQIPALPCFNPKMKSASTDAPLGNCSTPTDVRV